jgi:hypothetical protein
MISCPICNLSTTFLTKKTDRFFQEYNYHFCENCGFIFDLQKKEEKTYQKDYFEKIDIGWQERCDNFFKIIGEIIKIYSFSKNKKNINILDFGGGNGYLSYKLSEDFNIFYYDKYEKPSFIGKYKILEKPIKTDIIYAVELVEHFTDINDWNFLKELSPDVFVFTTCLSDNISKKNVENWVYLNPDAGHVSVYSTESLFLIAKKYGFVYFFFPNISCHIFLKNKFLSKINFVKTEYFIYKIFRKIINLFK